VVSELGGRANAAWQLRQLNLLAGEGVDPAEVSRVVKELEAEGASFEGADASLALLVRRRQADYVPPFRIVDFTVIVERRNGAEPRAEASVKVEVDGEVLHTAADGNGPVNALDLAMRKALAAFYPALDGVHLVDYKVRIVDGDAATAARTRVIIETGHESGTWITAGADANIIAASLAALHDSLEYAIWKLDARPERRDERASSRAEAQRRLAGEATA
jgi:2-isopropylmalate synthase